MSVLNENPVTHDNLLPNRFRFDLLRAPNVDFWCQQVILPGFSVSPAAQSTPFVTIPKSGDHIDYDDLGMSIIVDNQLSNYLELYTWLKSLGFPDNFDEYASLLKDPSFLQKGITSEISVFILDGSQKPTFRWTFHDAFPYSLGSMTLEATNDGLDRVTCNCAFKYRSFDIYRI